MKRKILILICLIVFMVSMAAVSATDDLNQTDDDALSISLSDVNVVGADEGTFSDLQKKIDDADEGSTITLECDYRSDGSGGITINKALTIDGNGHVIDALGSCIFSIGSSAVTLNNIDFKHGSVEEYGGAIYSNGNIALFGCSFIECRSHEHGGTIYADGDVWMVGCRFEDSICEEANGGAVYSEGNVNAIDCTFLNCYSVYFGGAIYCENNVDVLNCSFIGNSMDFEHEGGGAIHSSGNLTVYYSNFTGNFASSGGAIYSKGYFCIVGCNFTGNEAGSYGGAVYVLGHGSIADCSFSDNFIYRSYASHDGGAIYSGADLTISNSNFTGNYVGNVGGAVYSKNNLNLIDCSFLKCSAKFKGGAIYSEGKGNFIGCTFIDCSVKDKGGAIYSENDDIIIENSFFDKNLPNDFYPRNINTSNILISSHMNINFNKTIIYQFDAVLISITFDEGARGNVSVSINGVEERFQLTDNSLEIIKPNLSVGKYDVLVRYYGDEVFSPTSKTDSFKVVNSSFKELQDLIDNLDGNELDLTKNYTYVDYIDGNSPITIRRNIKINGNGYTLDGSARMGIFSISSPDVILNDINFVNGLNLMGGAVYSSVPFDVINCSFYNCSAWRGGAIYSESHFNVVDSSFDRCSLNRYLGDWIYGSIIWTSYDEGILTISNSTFTNPYLLGTDGSFYEMFHIEGCASFDGCSFVNCYQKFYVIEDIDFINSSFVNSTGIDARGSINVLNSTIVGCEFISKCKIDVSGSYFKYSYIYPSVDVNVSDSDLVDSHVKSDGTIGIFDSRFVNSHIDSLGNLTIFNSSFVNYDESWYDGGIIYCEGNAQISDSFFANSSEWRGGVIFAKGNVSASNSSFVNSSGWWGGAIYCEASVAAYNCSFVNLSATKGGAIYIVNDHSISLIDCIFNLDSAEYSSGIVELNSNSIIENCTFISNEIKKGYGGGVIYLNNKLSYGMDSRLLINLTNLKLKNNLPGDYGGAISFSDDVLSINSYDYDSASCISGDIFLDIAGKSFNKTFDSEGSASFELKGLPSGTWNARISYYGDNRFSSFEIDLPLTIIGSSYHLEVPDVTKEYMGSEKLEVTLTKSNKPVSNVDVNININGVDYTRKTDNDGKAFMDLNFNAGSYGAVVSYGTVSAVAKVTINQLNTKTTLNYAKNSYNAVKLTAVISPNCGGDVIFTVNGENYTASLSESKATYMLSGWDVGFYNAVAFYNGDSNHKSSLSNSISFVIEEAEFHIYAPELVKYYKGPERFNVTLKDNEDNPVANADVTININGKDYVRTTDENGVASMAINLNSGEYKVTSEFEGIEVESTITVKQTVSGENITKIFRNGTQYYATFVDTSGKTLAENTAVEFNINGVFYTRYTNDKGVARMNINLNPGEYVITAKNPSSTEQYTNIITVLPSIVENHDLTKYYRNASQYSLRLLDDKGNPVKAGVEITLNINGVFYKRISNDDGYVKMNINLEPGEYIITADYNGLMASNTIKVLSVIETHDLSMKYKDGSKFEARILDGQGNPYAGQTVTFNINGVFYERITDEEGIARLAINLMAGEYIITSSYNGLNAANTVTVSS